MSQVIATYLQDPRPAEEQPNESNDDSDERKTNPSRRQLQPPPLDEPRNSTTQYSQPLKTKEPIGETKEPKPFPGKLTPSVRKSSPPKQQFRPPPLEPRDSIQALKIKESTGKHDDSMQACSSFPNKGKTRKSVIEKTTKKKRIRKTRPREWERHLTYKVVETEEQKRAAEARRLALEVAELESKKAAESLWREMRSQSRARRKALDTLYEKDSEEEEEEEESSDYDCIADFFPCSCGVQKWR
jgi:hypothetical protein